MEPADRLEIHELPGRYGDAIDDRNWEGLGRVFTDDATFDLTDLGGPVLRGLDEIRRYMDTEATHPQTHLMANIYVDEQGPDTAMMYFRIVARAKGGVFGTASYYDDVVRTPAGWRVKDRLIALRRRPRIT